MKKNLLNLKYLNKCIHKEEITIKVANSIYYFSIYQTLKQAGSSFRKYVQIDDLTKKEINVNGKVHNHLGSVVNFTLIATALQDTHHGGDLADS